jgi:hypothetical protein
MDSVGVVQDKYRWRAPVNVVMNRRVPCDVGKLSSGCATGDLSSGAGIVQSVQRLVKGWTRGSEFESR